LSNVTRFSWEESARRVSQRIDTLINASMDRRGTSNSGDTLQRESSSSKL
jgi:hypothetical protein